MTAHQKTRIAGMVLAVAALAFADAMAAAALRATVVWRQADRAYLASPDSSVLETGMRITFRSGSRTLASGSILGVVDGRLASVRLTAGSLDAVKRLDRLRIFGERSPVVVPPTLRIGFPGRRRLNLVSDGRDWEPFLREYSVERTPDESYRLVRGGASVAEPAWPETLVVRRYDDPLDQEIALERGEIDVAVFWPGEPSARMRRDPHYAFELAMHPSGFLATRDTGLADPAMGALNRELFSGDLLEWPAAGPALARDLPRRYQVSPQVAGRSHLERVLNRAIPPDAAAVPKQVYLQEARSSVPGDSSRAAWRALGITPRLSVRLPVVYAPEYRDFVRRLGVDAFARLPFYGAPPLRAEPLPPQAPDDRR